MAPKPPKTSARKPWLKIDPLDLVVLSTLVAVSFSYYLGFGLDWAAESEALNAKYAVDVETPADEAADTLAEAITAAGGEDGTEITSWNDMVRRLHAEAIAYPGVVSIYLKDLKNPDRKWMYQVDDLFPSASLIKVPIMAAVMEKVKNGSIHLDDRVKMQRRHRTGGSGTLKWQRDGTHFSIRQLLERMIDESDNTAMRMLIDVVGIGYLQQQFPKFGLQYTEIYPEGLSLQSGRLKHGENYTTAREMSMLLEKIYRRELVDQASSEIMLGIMKRVKGRARLAKSLPVGWEIAHKTGLLRSACHDSAIIFSPQGDYVLTVLTKQNRSYSRAKNFIASMGRITHRYYRGDYVYAKANGGSSPDSARAAAR